MSSSFPTAQPGAKTDYDNADVIASADQNAQGEDINAIAAKLGHGTDDNTPASNKILRGTAAGKSEWDIDLKDEDDMSSDSATAVATQQSIKAYVDSGTVTMTNKTLTSPVINTQITGTAVKDEDDMSSNSATCVATQQSIKAYIDSGTVTMTNKTLTSPVLNSFTGTGGTMTVADGGNAVALTVTQNDTTNNPIAASINNTGTGTGLFVNQDGNAIALDIDTEATSANALRIEAQNTSGTVTYIRSNANQASGYLSEFIMENASSAATCIAVRNDGTGKCLFIDNNNASHATNVLEIDDESTQTSYASLYISSARESKVLEIHKTGGSTGKGIQVHNDGTGNAIFIQQDGAGVAFAIDSAGTTSNTMTINSACNQQYAMFYVKADAGGVSANASFQVLRQDNVNDDIVLVLGTYTLWVDSTGDLRINNGQPTSDTAGTVVGTQS